MIDETRRLHVLTPGGRLTAGLEARRHPKGLGRSKPLRNVDFADYTLRSSFSVLV
jgi:hypothetical protein